MSDAKRLSWLALVLTLTTIGLAHWLFGNLYEAIVVAPQWLFTYEAERALGRSSSEVSSPVYYFVPWAQFSTILSVLAFITARRTRVLSRLTRHLLGAGAVGGVAAQLLTAYVVTQINLELFFGNNLSLEQTRSMMATWQALNWTRVGCEVFTLVVTATSLQRVHELLVLTRYEAGRGIA